MSRIGKKPVPVPANVTVTVDGNHVKVKGPKGELERTIHSDMKVSMENGEVVVARPSDEQKHKALHGLSRTLVSNMVEGVSTGFTKTLELVGVGYKAEVRPYGLQLALGFSHPVEYKSPKGIKLSAPLPTQILVTISNNMWWVTPLLAVLVIAGIVWYRRNKNTEAFRSKWDPFKLKAPVFGNLARKIAVARFTRNFAQMIGAGVPILQALGVIGATSGNWVIEQATRRVSESVRQGQSLAKPLAEEPVFPPMVVQMMAVGEDSGSLEVMLTKIADFYDDEVEAQTAALTSLIEPLLIAFLGVVIGGMVVALYMPIFNIATAVQGAH